MFEFKEDDRMPLLEMGQLKLSPAASKLLGKKEIHDLTLRHLFGDFGKRYEIEIVTYDEIINYREKDIQSNYTLKGKAVYVITERDMNQSSIISCKCVECGKEYLGDRNDKDMCNTLIGLPVLDEDGEIVFIPTNEGRFGCNKNTCKTCLFEQIERL
ncbi:hypothetical protein [Bacillus altitudinis]|uniref:hypothetical protein n=1 Tax=Bacillus altitudinis TaxID=293387 RepID=UPI000D6C6F34|nr:hypothetical protein [Bacillus altitudinis]PWN86015.1 hypothetical protein CTM99_02225 [Bacillus altitudinis]